METGNSGNAIWSPVILADPLAFLCILALQNGRATEGRSALRCRSRQEYRELSGNHDFLVVNRTDDRRSEENYFAKPGTQYSACGWCFMSSRSLFRQPRCRLSSPLLEDGYQIALPYNEALFLNHGYHFFAPDPGASTLIAWEIPRDGDAPVVGRFPDVSIRPRLLYHRYFMLAENVWAFDEETQQEMLKAYARHFAGQFGSDRISISRMQSRAILNHPTAGRRKAG